MRSVVVVIVSLVIILILVIVLYLRMIISPSPSILLSSTGQPVTHYPAWNGYSPLLRVFDKTTQSTGNKSNTLRSMQSYSGQHIFSWIFSLFSPRPQIQVRPLSLPQGFQSSAVAGISIAHHNPFSTQQLAGVALLLHACRQSASDWFILPEHRRVTSELLRRKLAILAITSSNRITRCWSTRYPASQNYDAARVRLAVRQWSISQGIAHDTPFYAIGVSSGATFLSVLSAARPPFIPSLCAQAFYLSAGNPRAIHNASALTFPNTIFMRLNSDKYYAPSSSVTTSRVALLRRNVPLVADLSLSVEEWTAKSIHEHEPLITAEESAAIFEALPHCHHNIECAVRKAPINSTATNSSTARLWERDDLRRALIQVDRVLKGKHELSGSHAAHIVDWLIQNGREFTHSNQGE